MRALTLILAIALLVITTTSAYIRFTQAGLGCADWPDCYGAHAASLTPALDESDPLFLPRAMHRVAASAAGILVLVIAVMGWEQWGRYRSQWIAVTLVLLALGLAWLGLATPSPLPIVTLGNLLGGMGMLALSMRLFIGRQDDMSSEPTVQLWVRTAIVIGVVQIALGAMIGARYGATVCNTLPGCADGIGISSSSLAVFNPVVVTTAEAFDKAAIAALHLLHRVVAIILALLAIRIAFFAPRMHGLRRHVTYAIAALVLLQLVSGAWFVLRPTLWLALAHNLGAALLLTALACLGALLAGAPSNAGIKTHRAAYNVTAPSR
jgi:heme a synthase